jgi:GNAT superfamily N-acetyltransferase
MSDVPSPRAIEELAFDAWPAAEVTDCSGWRLRFNHGVTNRGNSVWACDWRGGDPLPALERVERYYRERGRGASFQVTPASQPERLDRLLDSRGYQRVLPVSVEWAGAEPVAALSSPSATRISCHEQIEESWFDVSGRQGRFAGEQVAVYRRMLEKLVGRACFALARDTDGAPQAVGLGVTDAGPVGLGVADGSAVGIFSMLTLPEHRGRGVGRALLAGIAGWARARGRAGLYLQVEEDNPAARALYRGAGFEPVYGYHYRRGPEPAAPAQEESP